MAGNRSLGNLTVDLILRSQGWAEGWTKAERDADKAQREIRKKAREAANEVRDVWSKASSVIGISIASITVGSVSQKMLQVGKDAAAAGAEVERLATLSNTTANEFQRLAVGANTVGISAEKMADIFKDVQDKVGDFVQTGGGGMKDFFEQIAPRVGVTADQFRKLSGKDALQLYVSSLEKANLTQSDMVFYLEAIASDSALLLPLLKDNGAAWKDLGDKAESYGAILDGPLLAAAKRYKEETQNLELANKGLSNEIAAGVLPALTDLNTTLADPSVHAGIRTTIGLLGDMAASVVELGTEFLLGIQYSDGFFDAIFKYGLSNPFSSPQDQLEKLGKQLDDERKNAEKFSFFWTEAQRQASAERQKDLQQQIGYYQALERLQNRRVSSDLNALGREGLDTYGSVFPSTSPLFTPTPKPKSTGKSQAEKDAEAAEKYLATLRDQYAAAKDLSAVQKLDYDLQVGKAKLTASQTAQAREYAEAVDRRVAAEKAAAEFAKEVARVNDELNRNDELREEIALIGLESEQIASINRQRVEAALLVKQQHAAELDRLATADAGWSRERANLQTEIDLLEERLELMDSRQARTKIAEAWKDQKEQGQRAMESIVNSFTDGLINGTQSFAQLLENTVFTVVVRPAVEGAVGGLLGGGNSSGAAGIANSLQSLYSLGTSPLLQNFGLAAAGNIQQIGGTLFSKGFEQLGTSIVDFGNTVAQFSDAINLAGDVFGYGSAIYNLSQGKFGSAAGAAIGTWFGGPVGSILGSTLGGLVDGLFGGDSGTSHMGAGAIYSGGALTEGRDIYNRATFGQGARGEYLASTQALVSGVASGLGGALDKFATTFGQQAGYTLATAFADDSSGDGAWGSLRIADAVGNVLVDWENTRSSKWAPRIFSDGEEGLQQYLNSVAVDVRDAFLAMDLPRWADQLIGAADSLETLNAALSGVAATRSALDALGKSIAAFAGLTGETETQLLNTLGTTEALLGAAGQFYNNFYSEFERMRSLAEQQILALNALGLDLDPTRGQKAKEQFRAAVEQALQSGQGELAAKLLAMSESFATTANYAQKLIDAVDDLGTTASTAVESFSRAWGSFSTLSSLAFSTSGNTSGLLTQLDALQSVYGGSIDNRTQNLQQQIAIEEQLWQAQQEAQQAARAAETQAAQERIAAAQEELAGARALQSAARGLRSFVEGLRTGELSGLSESQRLGNLRAQYQSELARVNAGDVNAFSDIQSTTQDLIGLAKSQASSAFDYAIESARIAAELEAAGVVQESAATSAADLLEQQIKAEASRVEDAQAQFKVSAATRKLIDDLLAESQKEFLRAAEQAKADYDLGLITVEALEGLPAGFAEALNSTVVPAIHAALAEAAAARAAAAESVAASQAMRYTPSAAEVPTASPISALQSDARMQNAATLTALTAIARTVRAWDGDGLPSAREEFTT